MVIFGILKASGRLIYFRLFLGLKNILNLRRGCSSRKLRDFFENEENFSGLSARDIAEIVGPWQEYDDWDWGRFLYEWIRPNLCVRLKYKSSTLVMVEFCDPWHRTRFGPREIIWERLPREVGINY